MTADTITDEQIDALWRSACGTCLGDVDPDTMHACTVAVNRRGDFTPIEAWTARVHCAEIFDARAQAEHTTQIEIETRGAQVGNSELHLYHRWSCSCGSVGPWGHSLWASGSIKSAEQSAQSHVLNARVEAK